MSDVTRILCEIELGDSNAAEQLLPLVYDELKKLAAAKLANEKSGQTLQATALVHEAYIRLVDVEKAQHWDSRGHFFAAAAEAMRRILVERARRKLSKKHGGECLRVDLRHHVSPLADAPLRELYLDHSAVRDVSPLAASKTLVQLLLPEDADGVEDLRQHPTLRRLSYRWQDGAAQTVDEFWSEYDAQSPQLNDN